MRVDLFDFDLPDELIALRPVEPRTSARLLVVPADGPLLDRRIGDLPDLLRPGDVLVMNDTRVIPARLRGVRRRADAEARMEAMLHLRVAPDRWRAFLRPAKKARVGETIEFDGLSADILEKGKGGEATLGFDRSGPDLETAIARAGELPLPPYIEGRRAVDERDAADYQTVYAAESGAVAAPTAGLHWTNELLDEVRSRGIELVTVTLHVGAGTFLPVKTDDTDHHRMHAEVGRIDPDAATRIAAAKREGRRIVAVGTTSLRLLEAATAEDGTIGPWAGKTDIFITPGYKFRAVDALMTNFHLPRSTLFMLVGAFSGLERMHEAYAHAIRERYRFYSYGDACLLERPAR